MKQHPIQLDQDAEHVNIKAFLYDEFGLCGCADIDAVVNVIKSHLEWTGQDSETRPGFSTLYHGEEGIFYLLSGLLDKLGFTEHGIAIRHPWLTDDGENLLNSLQKFSAEEIDAAAFEPDENKT